MMDGLLLAVTDVHHHPHLGASIVFVVLLVRAPPRSLTQGEPDLLGLVDVRHGKARHTRARARCLWLGVEVHPHLGASIVFVVLLVRAPAGA